jgi:DNA-binding beta-propeller fold protein YncE
VGALVRAGLRWRSAALALFVLAATAGAATSPAGATLGAPVYSGTIGGPGHAQMYPSGLDVNAAGDVFIADTGNDRVERYAADGSLVWSTGSEGPKTLGRFQNPRDVAVQNGKVFVADTGYNRIQVLDGTTGQALSSWSTTPGTIMGISAGVDGNGNPVILASFDLVHVVRVYSPTGTLIRTVGSPGSGLGQLRQPRDAATDSAGNIYVADYANNRIAKFSPTGLFIKNWGSAGGANTQFRHPYGVDVDGADHVWVADSTNFRISEFDSDGNFITKFGTQGTGAGQFEQLRRVAVTPTATPDVYGADLWDFKVEHFSSTGTYLGRYGDGLPAPDGGFNEPYGIAVDSKVFVADTNNQRIQRFDDTSPYPFETTWGIRGWGTALDGFNWPRDVTANATSQSIWVADTKNDRLLEFNRNGMPTGKHAGSPGSATGQLNWPYAIASYGKDVIVADTKNNRIERWDTGTLSVTWVAGGMNQPQDVTVVGNLVYVADTHNNRVVILNADTGAFISSFAGGGQIHAPEGIALDASGNIWISDTGWNRLEEFTATGTLLQKFGAYGTAHGKFAHPSHLEIAGGKMYVVDMWNDRVEVFNLP